MVITIHGTGIDLTDAIKQYAETKIIMLEKYFAGITKVEIDVGMKSRHHQKGAIYYAEVNLRIPGHDLRVVKEEENLYKAIDKVKDHFKVELDRIKGKMRDKDREAIREQKEYQA